MVKLATILLGSMLLAASLMAQAGSQIDREVDAALAELYRTTPSAKDLAKHAKGILVSEYCQSWIYCRGSVWKRRYAKRQQNIRLL